MTNTMFILTVLLLFGVSFCKSIQKQNITFNETQDDRIANLEKIIRNLESRINILNETEQKREPVMFYAIIYGSHFTLNQKSTVVFEKIIVNIGNHYNQYDGVFVAPRKGVYLFSWTITCQSSNTVVTELVVEPNVISSTGDTAGSGLCSGSMTALCTMKKGDHAFIRTTSFTSINGIYSYDNYPRSSYLGMIVRDDEY